MSEIKNSRLGLYGKVYKFEELGIKGLKPGNEVYTVITEIHVFSLSCTKRCRQRPRVEH